MESPLTGPTPFLRSDAELAIVVLASGDDASARDGAPIPVQEYVDFVRSLKPDPATPVSVSIIAPPPLTTIPRLTELRTSIRRRRPRISPLRGGEPGSRISGAGPAPPILLSPPCAVAFGTSIPSYPACNPNVRQRIGPPSWTGTFCARSIGSCRAARRPGHPVGASLPPPPWPIVLPAAGCWTSIAGPTGAPQLAAKTVVSCRGCADPNDPACAGP